MDFIVSLAHFCEIHGPTSILCTQILPISCVACYPPDAAPRASTPKEDASTATEEVSLQDDTTRPLLGDANDSQSALRRRPSSEPHTRNPSFSRRNQAPAVSQKSALLNQHLYQQLNKVSQSGASSLASNPATPFQSPPDTPRSPGFGEMQYSGSLGNSEAARRYGGGGNVPSASSMPTESCPNCSLSIPQSVSEQLPDGAPGSPTKDGKGKNGSPVLRTREAFVARSSVEDWPDLGASLSEAAASSHKSRRASKHSSKSPQSPPRSGTAASPSSASPPENDLFSSTDSLTAQPNKNARPATSDSRRTPPPAPAPPLSPAPGEPHAHTLTYLSTRHPTQPDAYSLVRRSCIRTLSCEQLPRMHTGPLFFGDETAGYTISFVFRLPDPCARGRLRRYALICWAGREERRAARVYKDVLSVFAGIAGRIIDMVERRDRDAAGAASPTKASPPSYMSRADSGSGLSGGIPVAAQSANGPRDYTPVSSFLSGRAIGPSGYPRRSEVRAKGLAELVGKDDLFVEIHAVFVRLLAQLGRGLGGLPMGMVIDSGIRGEVGEVPVKNVEEGVRRMAVIADDGGDDDDVNQKSFKTETEKKPATVVEAPAAPPAPGPDLTGLGVSTAASPATTPKWESAPRQQLVV